MVRLAVIAAVILMAGGCADIVEHSSTVAAGVNVYSAENLEYLGSFPASDQARSMLIDDDNIYFACEDGFFRSYSMAADTLLSETLIGSPSPSGYTDVELNQFRGSAYVIGTTGTILEVSLPECEVTDELTFCSAPITLETTTGVPGYLWIADSYDNTISQVRLDTNGLCVKKTIPRYIQINDLARSSYDDSLIVGTSLGIYKVSTTGPAVVTCARIHGLDTEFYAMSAIPGDSNFVAACGTDTVRAVGELWVYADSIYMNPPSHVFNTVPVSGELFRSVADENTGYVHVAGTSFEETSFLMTYQPMKAGDGYEAAAQVEVPGILLDMDVSDDGRIYVLTY